jgi:serine protease Do
VREMLARSGARKQVSNATLRAEMRDQMLAHQNTMLDQLHNGDWKTQPLGNYRVPVIPDHLARCWGSASEADKKNYRFETASCNLASGLYIDNTLRAGSVSTQHEVSSTHTLSALCFAQLRAKSFANERGVAGSQGKQRTAGRCSEDFIKTPKLNLRAVVCIRAYRKFEGLYDISAIVQSLDADREGLESTLKLSAVEYTRGLAQAQQFIASISRVTAK